MKISAQLQLDADATKGDVGVCVPIRLEKSGSIVSLVWVGEKYKHVCPSIEWEPKSETFSFQSRDGSVTVDGVIDYDPDPDEHYILPFHRIDIDAADLLSFLFRE